MIPLSVAIVDDERLARNRLRRLLRTLDDEQIAITLECADATELLECAPTAHIDALFLDIEMPGGDAFEILQRWQGPRPDVVLVTAYANYGVRAFDFRVIDYLLKPVSAERLRETIARLHERRRTQAPAAGSIRDDRIPLQIGQRTHLISINAIDAIIAQGNYIEIHTADQCFVQRRSLASFEQMLDARLFVRLRRSVIVRRGAINEIRSLGAGRYRIDLAGGRRFHSGRSHSKQILEMIA